MDISHCEQIAGLSGDWLVAAATLVAALVGAAGGSGFAYWLETRRRRDDETRRSVTSINRALFVLYRYWNEVLAYRKDVFDPVRGQPGAWLQAGASVTPVDANQPIDDGNLGFLLDIHGDKYAELMLQQDRFRLTAFLIAEHSRALLDAHQALSAKGVERGRKLTEAEVGAALGQYLTMRLQVLYEQTAKIIDENLASFESQFKTLCALGNSLFPDAHFIEVAFVEKPRQ